MLGGHHPSNSDSPLTHVTQDDLIDLTALAYEDVHPGVYPVRASNTQSGKKKILKKNHCSCTVFRSPTQCRIDK